MMENDKVGYKSARLQSLDETDKQTVNVWQQIGAKEPSAEANDVMRQNDNVGYMAATQMLADEVPTVNVWKQIGVQVKATKTVRM
mmetsp:Transcript_32995/g.87577  ORF Transcript_32995/g.87577 Transcript_32995/m.87577 type:complete len:85 (-) Transcript_32995:131-385(-)